MRGDASNLADLDHLFAIIRHRVGRLDVLVANAGIYGMQALEEVTEAAFDKTFDLNVRGPLFAVQKALPARPERPGYPAPRSFSLQLLPRSVARAVPNFLALMVFVP